jgi:predicted tellurium resistance membrane protein TerC
MEIFLHTSTWFSLLTLTFLEVILGIDNIIFISIVTNKLPEKSQPAARNIGLIIALVFRIILLFGISLILGLDESIYSTQKYQIGDLVIDPVSITGKSIIFFAGGLFLIAKSTSEMFQKLEKRKKANPKPSKSSGFVWIVLQIILLDVIFSFDSILTAIGLSNNLWIIIASLILSMVVMMLFSGAVSRFINRFPSLQILALSFLILIGFTLLMEAIGKEVPKGYVYFAIFFSLIVELINIRIRKRNKNQNQHNS